jgi:regulator of protease activity HflC (stomatin/prohibitin superfamily)
MPEVTDPRLLLRLNGPQGVQTRPADPRIPFQLQQERNQAAASQYAPSKAQADTAIAQANAGSAGVVAQAEAAKAQADAAKAQAELAKLREEQKKVDPKSGAYLALQTQIDRVNELYLNSIKGGAPNVLNSVIPDFLQSDKEAFDTAAQGLVNPFMAAFKVPGQRA